IFLRQTSDTLIGTYIEEPMYCIDSVHSLIAKGDRTKCSLKYILGILNSKLGAYMYNLLICETGKVFAQVKLTFLRNIPIKITSQSGQMEIGNMVDSILVAKKRDVKADTSTLEGKIDQQIYDLYNLTLEQIQNVEEFVAGISDPPRETSFEGGLD